MLRACLLSLIMLAPPAFAASEAEVKELAAALGLPEVIEVMRAEGIDYGDRMEEDLFPGRGGPAWDAIVDGIYNTDAMQAAVLASLTTELADVDVAPLIDFFGSDRGQAIIGLEVSAREALMDPDVEAEAEAQLIEMRAEADPSLAPINDFVEINDLVESNVMGAMNSNFAFYAGMIDGGAFDMTQDEALADVWGQEDQIRSDTDLWVHSYLAMAYGPLPPEDLEAYIAISETREGQALNRALFAGFDRMYVGISRALGLAAAGMMAGEDI